MCIFNKTLNLDRILCLYLKVYKTSSSCNFCLVSSVVGISVHFNSSILCFNMGQCLQVMANYKIYCCASFQSKSNDTHRLHRFQNQFKKYIKTTSRLCFDYQPWNFAGLLCPETCRNSTCTEFLTTSLGKLPAVRRHRCDLSPVAKFCSWRGTLIFRE